MNRNKGPIAFAGLMLFLLWMLCISAERMGELRAQPANPPVVAAPAPGIALYLRGPEDSAPATCPAPGLAFYVTDEGRLFWCTRGSAWKLVGDVGNQQ